LLLNIVLHVFVSFIFNVDFKLLLFPGELVSGWYLNMFYNDDVLPQEETCVRSLS